MDQTKSEAFAVVDYNPSEDTYSLPPEHASWLTREAGLNNLALQAQYIPLLAQVEEPIVECFRNGGGVPYSAYPRFQRLMAEDSGAVHDAALVETILPLTPGLLERLRAGIRVADIGCGRGHAINLMAQAFPQSHFTGYDISAEGIQAARSEAQGMGLTNARFAEYDVAKLEVQNHYDLITAFDAIHDQAHPAQVLAGIARALRPEGVFLMVDLRASSHLDENIDHLVGPFVYTISCMHCVTVSLSQNGAGLGAMWGEQKALQMLAEAGFRQVEVKLLEGDLFNNYYIATNG
jgi:ubiquinone/menaquinone biosynthesis C-methylase UbiE